MTQFDDSILAAALNGAADATQSGIQEGRKIGAREERARAKMLLDAAAVVFKNLPGALSNSLGRTSYEYGQQARECAERELANLGAAIAAYTKKEAA